MVLFVPGHFRAPFAPFLIQSSPIPFHPIYMVELATAFVSSPSLLPFPHPRIPQ